MKKVLLIILAVIVVSLVSNKQKVNDTVKIPETAIRFRVLANSNTAKDQEVKEKVRDKMQGELYELLKDTKTTDEARDLINNKIPYFENIVQNELANEKYSYKIDYGMHYFPEKQYKGVIYSEGEYESLLVTLGEGKGNNWWCVLFPPLCLLEAEESVEKDKIEYKSFIKQTLEKYFY